MGPRRGRQKLARHWMKPPAMASESLPAFPEDTTFHYLAEGAANVVYRFNLRPRDPEPSVIEEYGDGTPPPTEIDEVSCVAWERPYENKLVRFRKHLATTAPCAVAQAHWERLIKPLFLENQLVDQSLVEVRSGSIVAKLSEQLRGWELHKYPTKGSEPRPAKRQGIYLANDDHALLITDMTPHGNPAGQDEEIIEFKPKWLLQSPSAPSNSKRCRHCARSAQKNAERGREGLTPLPFFCPLDLTSDRRPVLANVAFIMLILGVSEEKVLRLAKWLQTTTILRTLKGWQHEFDKVGVLDADVADEKFLCAMTLRDCTVFIRASSTKPVEEWECRIGDLDLKSKDKSEYWRSVENLLIEKGWYEGTENGEDRQPNTCNLAPARLSMIPGFEDRPL